MAVRIFMLNDLTHLNAAEMTTDRVW